MPFMGAGDKVIFDMPQLYVNGVHMGQAKSAQLEYESELGGPGKYTLSIEGDYLKKEVMTPMEIPKITASRGGITYGPGVGGSIGGGGGGGSVSGGPIPTGVVVGSGSGSAPGSLSASSGWSAPLPSFMEDKISPSQKVELAVQLAVELRSAMMEHDFEPAQAHESSAEFILDYLRDNL